MGLKMNDELKALLDFGAGCYDNLADDAFGFDGHNMALPLWWAYAKSLKTKVQLITFDYHTDTNRMSDIGSPSVAMAEKRNRFTRNRTPETVFEWARVIGNDKQIFEFNNTGLLDEVCIVLSHYDDRDFYSLEEQKRFDISIRYERGGADEVNERLSNYVEGLIRSSEKRPYIVDIDLDYHHMLPPFFAMWWDDLLRHAALVTVAYEPSFCCEGESKTCMDFQWLKAAVLERLERVRPTQAPI